MKCVLYKKVNGHVPAVHYLWGTQILISFLWYLMYKSKAVNTHFILSCTWVFIHYSYCKLK